MTDAYVFLCTLGLTCCLGCGAVEVALWSVDISSLKDAIFRKTLYPNSTIFMNFQGNQAACEERNVAFNVSWYLRSSKCYNEIFNTPDDGALGMFGVNHTMQQNWTGFYSQGHVYFNSCSSLFTPKIYYKKFQPFLPLTDLQEAKSANNTSHMWNDKPGKNEVAKSWSESPYLFIVKFQSIPHPVVSRGRQRRDDGIAAVNSQDRFSITMTVKMKGPRGYSSPADWPLMMFFMVMCIVYVLFATLWLLWLICYWRDLLRIQFWIGAVIILGMLEKAVIYSEFQSIQDHGDYDQGAVIFAELLSALKRSLARILLIIVSLGYGIVRPRLGTTVPKLVAVGLLYLVFASVEGVLRVTGGFYGTVALIANITLSLTDSCVIWWVFISLSQTTRLLKLRRNVVKLSLYQHFTNTLIFSVLASVIFIIWTTRQFKLVKCQSGWRDMWVDDAFWRLLFSTILLVIMVLLRPSVNSQRFSHSPLIDEEEEDDYDDEAKEPMLNDAYALGSAEDLSTDESRPTEQEKCCSLNSRLISEQSSCEGMKMRGAKSETNTSQKLLSKEDSQGFVDEDLKWVEENMPTTVVDLTLPVVLDDEEELLKTKLERSKME